jgi:hypothetical protein
MLSAELFQKALHEVVIQNGTPLDEHWEAHTFRACARLVNLDSSFISA